MVRTLIGNRFILDRVSRGPNYLLFDCRRLDEFMVSIPYSFVLSEDVLDEGTVEAIKNAAKRRGSHVLAIADDACDLPCLSWNQFIKRCGGPVRSWLPLDPRFPGVLDELGHNRSVADFPGPPDELFEEFVQVGLEFLLSDRVIRYGQDRRFEDLPDGVALAGELILLYDAKAYSHGYPISRASIRQFADYVKAFNARYESYLDPV